MEAAQVRDTGGLGQTNACEESKIGLCLSSYNAEQCGKCHRRRGLCREEQDSSSQGESDTEMLTSSYTQQFGVSEMN